MLTFYEVKCVEPSYTLKKKETSKKNWHLYMHTHMRIRNYVRVGADLPPPGLNRVKKFFWAGFRPKTLIFW